MEQRIDAAAFKRFEHDAGEQSVTAYDDPFGSPNTQLIAPHLGELKPASGAGCSILPPAR